MTNGPEETSDRVERLWQALKSRDVEAVRRGCGALTEPWAAEVRDAICESVEIHDGPSGVVRFRYGSKRRWPGRDRYGQPRYRLWVSMAALRAAGRLDAVTALGLGWIPGSEQAIAALEGLTALERLQLGTNRTLTDLTPLAGLTGLRELHLGACPKLEDLGPLAGLTALKTLTIRAHTLRDLSPLAALTNLERLEIHRAGRLTDLSPLAGLTRLTSLHITSAKRLRTIAPLAGLTALDHLSLNFARRVEDLSPLAGMTKLRGLTLHRCPGIYDLAPLAGLTALERLELSDCGRLVDLSPLAGLPALKQLNLRNCLLTRPNSLRGAALAEDLRVDERGWLANQRRLRGAALISALYAAGPQLEALRHLNLRGRWEIRDLTPLARARSLRSLDLSGCRDLSPQPEAPSLATRAAIDGYRRALATALAAERSRTPDEARWLAQAEAMGLLRPPAPDPERDARLDLEERIHLLLQSRDFHMARQALALLEALDDPALARALAWGCGVRENGWPELVAGRVRGIHRHHRAWAALALTRAAGRHTGISKILLPRGVGLFDLSPLVGWTGLEHLTIQSANWIRDLSPLTDCARLHTLELVGPTALEDLSPLRDLPRLRRLVLPSAAALADLSPLRELPELAYVDLRWCRGLPAPRRGRHTDRAQVRALLEI